MQWQSRKGLGIWENTMQTAISETLSFQWQKVQFLRRGVPLPLSLTQGTTTPGTGRTVAPPRAHLNWGRKHNVAPYFCVQKDFAPSSSNCRPGHLLTCKKVGNAPYSSVPQSTWVTSPHHPAGGKLRRSPKQPASSPAGDSGSRAPARPRRAARPRTRAGKGRGGEQRAAAPVPRSPPTSRSRARRTLPRLPLPSRGKAGPRVPRRGGGRGPESPRLRGWPEPWALGRAAPPSRARQDAWGLVRPAHPRGGGLAGPGRGPPPEAGRIRRGPRPGAGGGRVPAAGRAGRPAGGRRVAAAPGLK